MKTTRFLAVAAICIALTFTFSGCSSDDGGGNNDTPSMPGGGPAVGAQLYLYDEDVYTAANISGKIEYDGREVGSVANGNVTIELPPTVPEDAEVLESYNNRTECTTTPADLKAIIICEYRLRISGDNNRYYMGIDAVKDGSAIGSLCWVYLNKAGKITCSETSSEGDTDETNIEAGQGWSTAYFTRWQTSSTKPSTFNGADYKWYYYEED
jgi:hypothetical protein